jgi:hypothetical protein
LKRLQADWRKAKGPGQIAYRCAVTGDGWSYGIAEHLTKQRLLFCVDAHRDGKRFIVKADDLLTAFLSLERGRSNAIARSEEHKKLA